MSGPETTFFFFFFFCQEQSKLREIWISEFEEQTEELEVQRAGACSTCLDAAYCATPALRDKRY